MLLLEMACSRQLNGCLLLNALSSAMKCASSKAQSQSIAKPNTLSGVPLALMLCCLP